MRLSPKSLVGRHHGESCVLMGNAPSMLKLPLGYLAIRQSEKAITTIGCNRILGLYVPDYYLVCDRRPFAEYRWLITRSPCTLLLSDTLFDSGVVSSCEAQPPLARCVDYYGWRPTTVGELDKRVDPGRAMRGDLEVVETNPEKPLHSGANIAYCMLQWAIILGFKRIGLIGIDLHEKFERGKPSHVGGGDASKGCRPAPRKTLTFFAAALAWAERCKTGISIVNLSPVKGPLDKFMGRARFVDFLDIGPNVGRNA